MKKIILFIFTSFILVYINTGISHAKMAMPNKICHSFLGNEFEGVLQASKTFIGPTGSTYTSYRLNCGIYNAFGLINNNFYSYLLILLVLLSGGGFFGYRKYKVKKLVTQSNIES